MKSLKITFFTLSVFLFSWNGPRFVVAPPFTSVENIITLSQGQTIEQVNSSLGIQAYDILYLNDGNMLCFYNYRLLDRKINIQSKSAYNEQFKDSDDESLSSLKSQTAGKPFYSEWKRLYVNFKDGKLTHFITDGGLEDANYIVLVNGTLKLLNSKSLEFAHFSKLSNFVFPQVEQSIQPASAPKGAQTQSNNNSTTILDKDRDVIENLLFPLKYNGTFKNNETPRKKKPSIIDFK